MKAKNNLINLKELAFGNHSTPFQAQTFLTEKRKYFSYFTLHNVSGDKLGEVLKTESVCELPISGVIKWE